MILVVGATGLLGDTIARRLLEEGRTMRILVRPASDYGALVAAGATAVIGDLKDPASLTRACDGVQTIVTTANAAFRGGADTFTTVDDEGNANLIRAAVAAGVTRFVFTSVFGSHPDSPSPLLRAKGLTEQRLRASGLPFTIIQPDTYMDVLIPMIVGPAVNQGQPVTLVGEGRRRHSFVAMRDVTALHLAALDRPEAIGQAIPIGGAEPVSWRDIVATIELELGRTIPIETIPVGGRLPGLPDLVNGVMTSLEMYDSPIDPHETATNYGVEPTSIQAWARQTFAEPARR